MNNREEPFAPYLKAFYDNGNFDEVFESLFNQVKEEKLLHAKKVLAIGCGAGVREIKFFKKYLPNIEKAVFVEPVKDCFKELNKNVASSFGADVETETHHCKFQEWKIKEDKFDVILMFQCLYDFERLESINTLKKCLEELTTQEGILYITIMDNSHDEANRKSVFNHMFKFDDPKETQTNDIKENLNFLKREFKEYPYVYMKDINSLSPDFIRFIRYYSSPRKSEKEILVEIESLKKKGMNGIMADCLFVVKGGKL